ncbi:MAG TPA: glucosamine-6-phosphate deaminase [Acidobacteriota bacterium]|nr:glucosamine-6-phosphate deaminase [Acidobacteriota bacterium]
MIIKVFQDKVALGKAAAEAAAAAINGAIKEKGKARIIVATGASQFEFLEALTATPGIDWSKVEMFHLDEYVGLKPDHPASFRKYLRERLIDKVGIEKYHLLDGEQPEAAAAKVGEELRSAPVDVAFVGIGENGHLAFNDPPADFETEEPYLIVPLDEACRRQQVGEGWFATVDDVPSHAISMTVRQILKAEQILCVVPDARKAQAVKACVEGDVSPLAPASILKEHSNTILFLDKDSSALLKPETISRYA